MSEPIQKSVLYPGKGEVPGFEDGAKVTFQVQTSREAGDEKVILDDSKKWPKPMELVIGKKFKLDVWEMIVKTMRVGEVSAFTVDKALCGPYPAVAKQLRDIFLKPAGSHKPHQHHMCGFAALNGEQQTLGYPDLDELLKKPDDLTFTMELLTYEGSGEYRKDTWALSEGEKEARVPQLRDQGNTLYRQKQYCQASKCYAEAIGILEQMALREKPGDQEFNDIEERKIPLLLNYAQCCLLQKDYYPVIEHCSAVLKQDPDNVKGLFRRARAHAAVWNVEEARRDFARVELLDPSLEGACSGELKTLAAAEKQKEASDRQKMKGLFSD